MIEGAEQDGNILVTDVMGQIIIKRTLFPKKRNSI